MQTSMTYNGSSTMKVLSGTLVAIQFVLFFAILYWGALVTTNLVGLLIQLSGLVLYILAYISFNQKYFSLLPLPKKGAYIIMHGPYSFLRHPMYFGMILITMPLTVDYFNHTFAVFQASFLVVTGILVYIEEYVFGNVDLNYKNYIKYTKMILPLLF